MSEPTPAGTSANPLSPVVFPIRDWQSTSLPLPGTSFVGREGEIEALDRLIRREDVRLVTLTGPGGVGKSRLGLQVAMQSADAFPAGVIFVELSSVPSVIPIATRIADTIGLRGVDGVSIVDRLVATIHNRAALLVLDGFERHISEAMVLADLMGQCERLTILVTSREPLRLSAEWVREVAPLIIPSDAPGSGAIESEAVTLFVERAQAVVSEFVIDHGTAGEIAAIVRALDGLPLAIELAAARLAHLTPRALLRRMDRKMNLLTSGSRDLPERQQTLRQSIAWSHDSLTPEEQLAFRRLSVFVRGFTLDAADQVIGVSTHEGVDLVDTIGALVSRSLIHRVESCDGEPRFDMLGTLREYAAEQLDMAGESSATRDRHAAWFMTLAESADPSIWGGPDHVPWLDRLEADLDNLRAALAWLDETDQTTSLLRLASALGGLWYYRSHRIEGRRWLRTVLGRSNHAVSPSLAMAHIKLGMMERELGGPDAADLVEEGLRLRRQVGDRRPVGRALMNLGNVLKDQEEYERALDALEEAERILREAGDIGGLATTIMYIGIVAFDRGEFDLAETHFTNALALHQQDGFTLGEARTTLMLGRTSVAQGYTAQGANLYAASLDLWLQARNVEGFVDAMVAVAALAVDQHRQDLAATLLGTAESLGGVIGYVLPRRWRNTWERAERNTRSQLGEPAYDTGRRAGHLLGREAAAAMAAEWLDDVARLDKRSSRAPFTPREHDVLRLLVEGRSDREIALELGLKYRTVTSYVRNVLDKLDASSRTAAATRAVREGLLD